MIAAVQIIIKYMLCGKHLIAAIRQLIRGVFQTIHVVTTGIHIVLTEVITGTHFIGNRQFLTLFINTGSIVGIDIKTGAFAT